tara:strand:+ start:9080 stop:9691 length:612 start_codon:yes stop_codon:yes gene_type:complete
MHNTIENVYGSERSVESIFAREMLIKYLKDRPGSKVLDVGGIPTHVPSHNLVMEAFKQIKATHEVADFRGGKYRGDFVTMRIPEKFDCVMFISSLEHFPQCTEGDLQYRDGEDRKGYEKALSILKDGGKIILTVPYGKHVWQEYHQNYDWQGIRNLTKGSSVVEEYCYRLVGEGWVKEDPHNMTDILYTDKAYGVGCFVFEKD